MPYHLEDGRVTHTDDYGEVDSEIVFTPASGETPFQIVSATIKQGANAGFIQRVLMKMIMNSMHAALWDVVAEVEGKPYQLQGRQPTNGFDLAGLIQYIYNKIYGVAFPANLKQQMHAVQLVPVDQVMPGDIVFWVNNRLITNAGIYLGGGRYLTVDVLAGQVQVKEIGSAWMPNYVGSLR
ncbi:C40 family peptidase [Weissella halotolerans]|uniref:YwtD n=1 Tax=Weissella halotolerans DSM 20190 TaxID=1123500 RepID=A0A0R2FW40_9LACO|nr:NlpC/P60 family protein [Weissella halotolerans]KRN32432.1 YwtD [Weissella halotolerans DSM 20190]